MSAESTTYPKVLIVSHNVLSATGNMGKSMMDMLSVVPPECLAQLYFHSEIPTTRMCLRYFRVTDGDVLKSVLSRKPRYHEFGANDVQADAVTSRTDEGMTARVYQYSRRRTPIIYWARNLLWRLGVWRTPELLAWARAFDPDVIFFASGDYSFAYDVVLWLAEELDAPVVMWCCDDHYLRPAGKGPLGRHNKRLLMEHVTKLSTKVAHLIVISDKMRDDYGQLFSQPISVIRISAERNGCALPSGQRAGIVYAGNLGVNRVVPLVELGQALRRAGMSGYSSIDVYSADKNEETLAQLTEENGIAFHGAVGPDELEEVLGRAKYVLLVEAFDEGAKNRTRYSLSTKVAEYLQSGACVIAYGPPDISCMEYLDTNNAAAVIHGANELPAVIERMNREPAAYKEQVERAFGLAELKHSKVRNDEKVLSILNDAARARRGGSR